MWAQVVPEQGRGGGRIGAGVEQRVGLVGGFVTRGRGRKVAGY
jgi:hypothetical protein